MYIKFWRSYVEDKKDKAGLNLSPESPLSVELEGEKDKETAGNTRLNLAVCVFLTIICLVLLLVVIILSVKSQTVTQDKVCPLTEETTKTSWEGPSSFPTCSHEQCQALFPNIQSQTVNCRQCVDGWLTFDRMCFYLSMTRLTWDESQSNCRARGGSLAVITSQSVQNFLTRKGKPKLWYWIGLRKRRATWSWVNNTMLGESYWEDDTADGDCGILHSESPSEKNWKKASCQASTYFICQLAF